ncbi:MAG: YeeE/YedE family protein [Chitinophagaceae bacterium]|nr:YeeE/YedE family protein [Chitinophagaceae bacterium]
MSTVAENKDLELRSLDAVCYNESELRHPSWYNIKYLLAGLLFGIILVKSEVISWFRIQEMFRLESFHMFGVIGSAVCTGMISIWLIKKFKARTIHGETIVIPHKPFQKGQIYGGLLFGAGWALTGACPPFICPRGQRRHRYLVALLSAIAGTWRTDYCGKNYRINIPVVPLHPMQSHLLTRSSRPVAIWILIGIFMLVVQVLLGG